MGKASLDLINMMTDFLISEIGSKSFDGITYALITSNNKTLIDKYMSMRKEASKCGYTNDEAFRIYEVSNGYIFDMDLSVAKKIMKELVKAINKTNGVDENKDLIGDAPDKRRKADILSLAKYVKSEFDKGNNIVEVALFSRNSTPRIMITGIGPKNEMLTIKYNAYAIRHWDIETANSKLLIPAGIRISKIEPCEILPSKTGVKFKLYIEEINQY